MRAPKTLSADTIKVEKTARYYTLGEFDDNVREVWFVCHGYSQLAEKFIRYFEALDDGSTIVVAPEALSLFYLNRFAAEKGDARKVGATWMTRENRVTEMEDYVNYLEALCTKIFEKVNRNSVRVTVFGFSQGAATVSRWVAGSTTSIDRLILWAGGVPPDLDLKQAGPKFNDTDFHLVIGNSDELISDSAVAEQEAKLKHYGISYDLTRFDGGHHMAQKVLRQIADREF
jgi:predicted esterase